MIEFIKSLKDMPKERILKVRHQYAYEYDLLQEEHDWANALLRLRYIEAIDFYLHGWATVSFYSLVLVKSKNGIKKSPSPKTEAIRSL